MRASRRALVISFAILFGLAGLCATPLLLYPGGSPSAAQIVQLQADVEPAIARLEQLRVRDGRYPARLKDAGIELPRALYGGWRYRVADDGSSFEVSIGDYLVNGIVIY